MASCSTQESSTSASAAFDPSPHPFLVLDKIIFTNYFSSDISPIFSALVNTILRRETFTGCERETLTSCSANVGTTQLKAQGPFQTLQ